MVRRCRGQLRVDPEPRHGRARPGVVAAQAQADRLHPWREGDLRREPFPGSDRGILRTREALRLCDARTGEPLAGLADGKSHGAFLADGRIAVTQNQPAVELRIFSADGRSELWRFRFTGVRNLEVVDQPAPSLLRVAGLRTGAPRPSWEVWLVDLETGGAKTQGTRRLAELKPPVIAGPRFSLEDKDGVIWYDPWKLPGPDRPQGSLAQSARRTSRRNPSVARP